MRDVQSWEEPDLGLTRDSKAEATMGVRAGVGRAQGGVGAGSAGARVEAFAGARLFPPSQAFGCCQDGGPLCTWAPVEVRVPCWALGGGARG